MLNENKISNLTKAPPVFVCVPASSCVLTLGCQTLRVWGSRRPSSRLMPLRPPPTITHPPARHRPSKYPSVPSPAATGTHRDPPRLLCSPFHAIWPCVGSARRKRSWSQMEVKGHLLSRSCCSTNLNFAALLGFFLLQPLILIELLLIL